MPSWQYKAISIPKNNLSKQAHRQYVTTASVSNEDGVFFWLGIN